MEKSLLSVCLLIANLAFAGPVTKSLTKAAKAADKASKEMATALKLKGWKTEGVFRNENIIHVDTSAGQSTLSIEANQLTGWKFNSKTYTGKEIKDDVVDESYQATGKIKSEFINGSGGFFDTFAEMAKIGRNRVSVADGHRHSALSRTNGQITDVELGLYQHDVTKKKEVLTNALYDGSRKPFQVNQFEIQDVTNSITQSKITFEIPGKVMYQEVVEVKGNVFYQAVYKNKDEQLISQRWKVNTDKDGKNPVVNKFGKAEIVQDLGQFNLQVIDGKKSKAATSGVR